MSVAFLVAENPWFTPRDNPGQASSLPFIHGVAKLLDIPCYYSSFYEKNSFESAINHLTQCAENSLILYVGGHGDGDMVGETKIASISNSVSNHGTHIKGLILSSCHGGSTGKIAPAAGFGVDGNCNFVNGPNWVFSYTDSVNWMISALLEQAILTISADYYQKDPQSLYSKGNIVNMFSKALCVFSPNVLFNNGDKLSDTFSIFCRPRGTNIVRDITDDVEQQLV